MTDHMTDVMARHEAAYGDEHDEDCPLCGVDAQQPEEVRTIDLTPTWLGILPGLLDVVSNGTTVEARKLAETELRNMAGLADAHVATLRALMPLARTLRAAVMQAQLTLSTTDPAILDLIDAARDLSTRL